MAVAPAAEAAIQYSGPQNVNLGVNSSLNLDIDLDGDNDFLFTLFTVYSDSSLRSAFAVYASANARVLDTSGGYFRFVRALSSGYNVANTPALGGSWATYGALGYNYYDYYIGSGNFPGQGPTFMGIQFENSGSGQMHFGWIRVALDLQITSLTIIDWAWEDIPGNPILAGDSGAATVVPTLNEWGLGVLTTMLAGAAVWKVRRKVKTLEA